ncbi:beta-hydroxyacyl-ACP dehydratase [Aureitalea sp. L0-47]|uniref:3-hydroxyacyl-ACP dehydratase FabZ family protein n=1 Tax=Aureitalea sp. L0-47 TaxID=2816962 RepID=UPI002238FFB3|nr:3-hydroxyacyl-ACP dehydratase FabZ family protein [Aureitalea sp. L0-47]MCW5519384.1 beta-hydroxyacyl-ACP dehydratase [Aureitalea sp. L0-47]
MDSKTIISKLPYSDPFLFVDDITEVDTEHIIGQYTFKTDEYFYQGHFKGHPVTPGVILTECMAQIGLVSFGIYLLSGEIDQDVRVALSSIEIDFLKPVYPGELVTVHSEKIYFRFNKLKCKVKMINAETETVCNGTISGMLIPKRS